MTTQDYIETIYNFLNNTQGYIEDFQLKFLCQIMQIDYNTITIENVEELNSLLEWGGQEEKFFDYLVELGNRKESDYNE